MEPRVLNGALFLNMVTSGNQYLEANKEIVNSLNVFPVPDGDTGTNMSLSFGSGVQELKRAAGKPIGQMAEALSKGLLMGARGNSGVILSQLMRGFAKAVAKVDEVDAKGFAEALQQGVQTAYQAVVKPVEGTILTVAKDAARKAVAAGKNNNASLVDVMQAALAEAQASLKRTPDLLPVLKQAGVVDSGGQGLVYVYQGFLAALKKEEGTTDRNTYETAADADWLGEPQAIPHGMPAWTTRTPAAWSRDKEAQETEFGYCTEFIVRFATPYGEEEMERLMRDSMQEHGDSLLVVAADDIVKVHIHSEHPGRVLETAISFGPLIKIKIDNMTEQHHSLAGTYDKPLLPETEKAGEIALVAVVSGDGLQEIFSSIGVSALVSGGQTQNPSTEDLLNAALATGASHVFLLPNNSNIRLAAEQASQMAPGKITVIPSQSVPQGLAAVLAFDPALGVGDNQERMQAALSRIQSGQVTRAVRTTQFQEREISEGDYLGLHEGKLVKVSRDLTDCLIGLFEDMINEKSEIATLFYGNELSEKEAADCIEALQSRFAACEFEMHFGGQPLYPFLISVE